MPLKIAYVLARYPVLSQTFVHAELTALREAGAEVDVIAVEDGNDEIRFGDIDGAPLKNVWDGNPDSLLALLGRYDHIHTHFADVGVRTVGPLAAMVGRPWSMTVHAYDLFRADAAVRPDEWRNLPGDCRKVVAISRFHREFLAARGCDPRKVVVIPNAARLVELLRDAPEAPTQLRRVLAVGRPVAKKGFPILVQAWARARATCPTLELEIIGGEGLVQGDVPGLRLTPMRPYAEVLRAMAAADLIVAPSVVAPDGDMDGIPTVLAEAGALRRPVVASSISGVGDLVANGINGFLVPPGDVDALATTLVRLVNRPAELQRLGAGGPALAAAHDSRAVADRLLNEAFAA